jgi:glycosyltransferase involved in cell wall biosynthesis
VRVLVVHNNYSSRVPSGENLAVHDEVAWLREAGVEVHLHEAHNDDVVGGGGVERARQALWTAWSRPARRAMAERLRAVEPDLVHVHNLFPLLTASVVPAATGAGLPVVWTAHNHRVTCVEGGNFRAGAPCARCRPGWRAPGIAHGCYADSVVASALVTTSTSLFRSMARRRVATVAISEHMRDWLVDRAGFHPDRVEVKPNGVAGPALGVELVPADDSRTFLFVGRLDRHKGVGLLLDAWERTRGRLDARLHLLGDGEMASAVEAAAATDDRITWFGAVPPAEVAEHLGTVRAVVAPAIWEEPFGRVAAEALAYRRGLVVTRRGALPEVAGEDSSWVVDPEPAALAEALVAAAGSDAGLAARTRAGHDRYARAYSPEATTNALLALYEREVARRSAGDAGRLRQG